MNQAQTEQATLPLFEAPEKDAENVRWLENYLKSSRDWMEGGALELIAGREKYQGRWVRALAQASEWVISGQKGYKHLEHATAEEVSHFVNWMESQGKKMIGRAEKIRRNAHAIFGRKNTEGHNHE